MFLRNLLRAVVPAVRKAPQLARPFSGSTGHILNLHEDFEKVSSGTLIYSKRKLRLHNAAVQVDQVESTADFTEEKDCYGTMRLTVEDKLAKTKAEMHVTKKGRQTTGDVVLTVFKEGGKDLKVELAAGEPEVQSGKINEVLEKNHRMAACLFSGIVHNKKAETTLNELGYPLANQVRMGTP